MPRSKAFQSMYNSVRKSYLGKEVPSKFRNRYGKRYDKSEIKSVAIAIAKSRGIKIDK